MKPVKLAVRERPKNLKKKNKLFLLGVGYPWYVDDLGHTKQLATQLALMSGPNRQEGRVPVELQQKWGAWQKVRVWIEKV